MRLSPHYSGFAQRDSRGSRSDGEVRAALAALRHVAALDPDGARLDNGVGFSVSDVARGHALAKLLPMTVLRSPTLRREVSIRSTLVDLAARQALEQRAEVEAPPLVPGYQNVFDLAEYRQARG